MDFAYSVIAMMSPEDSWVAKWQRIGNIHTPRLVSATSMIPVFINLLFWFTGNFKAGIYAVTVTGRLPPGWLKICF